MNSPKTPGPLQRAKLALDAGHRGYVVGAIALGLVLIVAGALLITRPLTSVLVLTGASVVWLTPQIAAFLPIAAAFVLLANAARLGARAVEGGGSAGRRVIDSLFAVANALGAALCLMWPDAATVVLGAAFALALILVGIRLVWRAIRGTRGGSAAAANAAVDGSAAGRAVGSRAATHAGGVRHGAVGGAVDGAADSSTAKRGAPVFVRGVAAVLAVLLTGSVTYGSVQLLSQTARADDFYAWAGDVPPVPGKVLRVTPYEGEIPTGAKALKVLYSTTYSDGSPALASAVVAFPEASAAAGSTVQRDVLAWQHGTTGVDQDCGPSVAGGALTEYAIPGISRAIERGWVVVATDYPGQGTAGRYPYLIGEGEGRATLDGIRAAQQLDGTNASNRAWIWGHSQGGHATLWAGEMAGEYAPELQVLGVAALSAAADPLALAEKITGKGSSPVVDLITSYVLKPYADEYADVSLDASVHPAGHGLVRAFASRCATAPSTLVTVLTGLAIGGDAPLYTIDLTAGPTRDRLAENFASGLVPAPLFLGQGVDDEVIPIAVQRGLSAQLCAADRVVTTHEYPGRTHMGVIAEGAPLIDDLYAWADRVAAGEQPTNC